MSRNSKSPLDESDKLMRKVAEGDSEAFKSLYHSFAPILRQLFVSRGANLASSDDFIQKIFTYLWERRKDFRGESSFETYLISIARHTLNKEIKQSRKTAETGLKGRPGFDGDFSLSQPEYEFYLKEMAEALERAKAKLTAKQRQALGASQEAYEKPGCFDGAFRSRLKRARSRLWELMALFFHYCPVISRITSTGYRNQCCQFCSQLP